jgi:hypothetical protein
VCYLPPTDLALRFTHKEAQIKKGFHQSGALGGQGLPEPRHWHSAEIVRIFIHTHPMALVPFRGKWGGKRIVVLGRIALMSRQPLLRGKAPDMKAVESV